MNKKRPFDPIQFTAEEAIIQLIFAAGKSAMTQLDQELEAAGLSGAKIWALSYIVHADESIGVRQLAQCMRSGKSNATQMIDRLEAENLARRRRDPDDRRSVRIEATEEGKRRLAIGEEIRKHVAQNILSQFAPDERAQLIDFLGRIIALSE